MRELLGNGRNGVRGGAAVSYNEVPINCKNERGGGGLRGCSELPWLPRGARKLQK